MSKFTAILKKEFPAMDNESKDYVEGVLESIEDFETADDIYDAVGDILQSVNSEKSEDDVRQLCEQFFNIMNIGNNNTTQQKVLNAPVNIAEMAKNMESGDSDMHSIWLVNKDAGNVGIYDSLNSLKDLQEFDF